MFSRRLFQLTWGLFLYGFAIALMIRADLGLNPWDVFHQGAAALLGWSIGTIILGTGVIVLLLWIPLRQRPGLGTIANILIIGLAADIGLALIPPGEGVLLRGAMLLTGTVALALAAGAYIGAGLGPGPRDGLMTGLVQKTGWRLDVVRTGIELAVLACGWLLGGTVGIGTILFAAAIGPLIQFFLPLLTIREPRPALVSGECLEKCAP